MNTVLKRNNTFKLKKRMGYLDWVGDMKSEADVVALQH
jgi:hypothetical protein